VAQERDEAFYDDPSRALSLSHSATHADEEAYENAVAPHREEHEARIRAWVEDRAKAIATFHKLPIEEATAIAESDAGVRGMDSVIASNRGSFDAVERRARALMADLDRYLEAYARWNGMTPTMARSLVIDQETGVAKCSLLEAWKIAWSEQQQIEEAVPLDERDPHHPDNRVDASTLQREGFKPTGGSRSSRKGRTKVVQVDRASKYDEMLAEASRRAEPAKKSAVVRAHEELRRNEAEIDRQRPGPHLKGAEPRMTVSGRVEPTTIINLHDATGTDSVGELLEAMESLVLMAKNGAQADLIIEALTDLVSDTAAPPTIAPCSSCGGTDYNGFRVSYNPGSDPIIVGRCCWKSDDGD
jgi:hypothetical protein